MKRKIIFYGDYFLRFYSEQGSKTKEKIDFVLDLIRNVERVPIKFLKYLPKPGLNDRGVNVLKWIFCEGCITSCLFQSLNFYDIFEQLILLIWLLGIQIFI